MPTITDWIMVGITFLYMLFTIGIFIANLRSSESAKSQLEETKKQMKESKNQFEKEFGEMRAQLNESKRQFEESQRLECMPFLQLETAVKVEAICVPIVLPPSLEEDIYSSFSKHYFLLRNLGKGTAINLFYTWEDSVAGHDSSSCPSISAIMNGDSYHIRLETKNNEDIEGWIEWHFDDMNQHHYHQRVKITIRDNRIIECDNDQVIYDIDY